MNDAFCDDLVGMMEDEATVQAMNEGYTVRVTRRDGNSFPVTRDYRTDRVNFDVEQNVVVAASVG
jgi:hypothetical protein